MTSVKCARVTAMLRILDRPLPAGLRPLRSPVFDPLRAFAQYTATRNPRRRANPRTRRNSGIDVGLTLHQPVHQRREIGVDSLGLQGVNSRNRLLLTHCRAPDSMFFARHA